MSVKNKQMPKPLACLLTAGLIFIPINSAATTRAFEMAATAVQLIPLTAEPYRNGSPANPLDSLVPDVDVITLWPEYLGIPFDEFAQGPTISPTHPWAVRMNELAAKAGATGKPLMVELSLVRTGMVPKAVEANGELQVINGWAPVCYDFTQTGADAIGQAYINYAVWMANTFNPKYLVNFIEANLYFDSCGGDTPSWNILVDIQQSAYDAVKTAHPDMNVFPSIHIETLYGYDLNGWNETQYGAISELSRDMIGISSYPFGVQKSDGRMVTPYDLPADYLVRIKLKQPQESLSIAETGWNNSSISIGDTDYCIENFPYSEERFVQDYLRFVFASAHFAEFKIVNWWSMADSVGANVLSTCYVRTSVPFMECGSDPWCMVINYIKDVTFEGGTELFSELVQKAFGSMGLKQYDGTERTELMQIWRDERSLNLNQFSQTGQ